MRALLAALLAASHMANADAETLYESSLGPNGGAPYLQTRAQLDAMGGTWDGERFFTHAAFANTSDPFAATFMTQAVYTPVRRKPERPPASP